MQCLLRNPARCLRHYRKAPSHRMRPSAAHLHAQTTAQLESSRYSAVLANAARLFSTALAEHRGVVRAGGLEPPQALLPYGFSYQLRLSPPSPSPCRRVCGLDYPFTMLRPGRRALLEGRCCPSSLYTFPIRGSPRVDDPSRAWLGIAMGQGFPEFGQFCIRGFPRSTQVVPQVRCVYRFRHARVTRPLYRPGPCLGRRAA